MSHAVYWIICMHICYLEWCGDQLRSYLFHVPACHTVAQSFSKLQTRDPSLFSMLFTSLSALKSWIILQARDVYRVTQYCFVLHNYNYPPQPPFSCMCVQQHEQRVRRPCGKGWFWPWLSACSLRAGGRRVAQGAAAASYRRHGRSESWIPWRSRRARWRWWLSFRPADPSAWCRRPSRYPSMHFLRAKEQKITLWH